MGTIVLMQMPAPRAMFALERNALVQPCPVTMAMSVHQTAAIKRRDVCSLQPQTRRAMTGICVQQMKFVSNLSAKQSRLCAMTTIRAQRTAATKQQESTCFNH